MATLEKIRSQQKLLFTIVIIALFLFIISIASADSIRRLFGPGTTIAKVGGKEIDYNDYRQLIDKYNQQQQQQKMNHDELSQRAISSLIQEALVKDQIEKLGIRVTDSEISRAMTGELTHPSASRFIQTVAQYLQLPNPNGAAVLDAINNPGRYNLTSDQLNYLAQNIFGTYTMADAWAQQEQAVEQSIQQQVFASLLNGLFTANKLDAQSIYNDNSNTSYVTYVTAPYSTVSDDEIEVTDADLKAKYNENKALYKLTEETREVDYIIVPIEPSADDFNAAELEVDRLVEALQIQPGLEGAVVSSKFVSDNATLPVSEVKKNRDLSQIPDSLIAKEKVYKYRRNGNTFRVAKVTDVTAQIDSINVSMYQAVNSAEADSVYALIKEGKTFAELANESQQAVDSMWNTLVGAPADITARFTAANIGETFVYTDSVQGINAVYRVNKRNPAKQFADVTLFTYVVDPSATTVSDIKTQLSSFLASNSKADAFSANADSLYMLRHAVVTPSTPKLGYNAASRAAGFDDTRHAIKWAMNAKKGEVSPILEDNRDFYVVVALKDIYGDQYIPYTATNVKDVLTAMVKADKKGDVLVKKYQGAATDIAGYAQAMGTDARTDSTIVFGAPRFATLYGNEYAIQAAVGAAEKGHVVGPVKGENEVMVFIVDDTTNAGRPFDFDQDKQAFMNAFGIKDFNSLLLGDRKIKNNSLLFENYDK